MPQAPATNSPAASPKKKSVDGILATSLKDSSLPPTVNNKLQELEEATSINLAQIKKIKSEYRQLVERVKKELERIKIEKVKKSI